MDWTGLAILAALDPPGDIEALIEDLLVLRDHTQSKANPFDSDE